MIREVTREDIPACVGIIKQSLRKQWRIDGAHD